MFFEGDRIDAMREMILADNVEDRKPPLKKLLPLPAADFVGIFKAMKGFPATIRFLDPPLHEFLPTTTLHPADLAAKLGVPAGRRSSNA
jgi:pyruvate, orthophosphate dikinase